MQPITFQKAKLLVEQYNELRDVRAVAKQLKLSAREGFQILNWLWSAAHSREADLGIQQNQPPLPELTKARWANYLYAHNVSVEAAADSLGWSPHDVLHSCGGPAEWLKPSNRKVVLAVSEDDAEGEGPAHNDPAPEDIAAAAAAIQASWTPSQRRVADMSGVHRRVEISHWSDTRV